MKTELVFMIVFLSVICIASPIIYWMGKKEEEEIDRELRDRYKRK